MDEIWPEWELWLDKPEMSMRWLARYANPEIVGGLRLGSADADAPGADMVHVMAERVAALRVDYHIEPFNPRGRQVIRTTSELLDDGLGTCADFVVTLATALVEHTDPILAVAVSDDLTWAHAFVVIQQVLLAGSPTVYQVVRFDHLAELLSGAGWQAEYRLLDVTPIPGQQLTVAELSQATLEGLKRRTGLVHLVDVKRAVQEAGGYYQLPDRRRDLGLTTLLPDPPRNLVEYPSHNAVLDSLLGRSGTVVLRGDRGVGKSTLALRHAHRTGDLRGWFLDGSDQRTLIRSLARAEARSSAISVENEQDEELHTLAGLALARLARSSRPWIVIVDNADGDPDKVRPMLPIPRDGQQLIVTSTNPAWERVASVQIVQVGPLTDADVEEAGLADAELLDEAERLPGLARIARQCEPARLQQDHHDPGAGRLIRAAVGPALDDTGTPAQLDAAAAALAAAYMPAEGVTAAWVAAAQWPGEVDRAVRALASAAELGLVEPARHTGHAAYQASDEEWWMHRLIRLAVRALDWPCTTDSTTVGLRVLAVRQEPDRISRYSTEELQDLAAIVLGAVAHATPQLVLAAGRSVLDLLEQRGSDAIATCGEIATRLRSLIDPTSADAADLDVLLLMAITRVINHENKPTAAQIEQAIDQCLVAERIGATIPDARQRALSCGRAQAMRGILLKKLSGLRSPDDPQALQLVEESLRVLHESYQSRRAALTIPARDGAGTELDADPEHHVDRGWFNLGGANIQMAHLVRRRDRDRMLRNVSDALDAYAGSLALRRRDRRSDLNVYAAASLYGVALALYYAAMWCPQDFTPRLTAEAVEVEELTAVVRAPGRVAMLRAAEVCGGRALEIRAAIDGPAGRDTTKVRDLLRKVSLAWVFDVESTTARQQQLSKAVTSFCADADLSAYDG